MRTRYLVYLLVISGLSVALAKFRAYEPPAALPLDNGRFLQAALTSANSNRQLAHLRPLETSQKLQASIQDFVAGGDGVASEDLHNVFSHVEASLPQVYELAANLVYAKDEEQLIKELGRWADLDYKNHSHYAACVFRDPAKHRLGCLAVLAHELPRLQLPLKLETGGAFYAKCKLCGRGHGITLADQAQNTLVVTCPKCLQPYDLIASDSNGQWRRANQFFTGMRSPKVKESMSEMEKLMAIWKDVSNKCRYQLDAERISGSDSWESPADTYRVGSGDCEDTSLLLADMLIAEGFEARVALGHLGGEGHAWCVVNLDGQQYILESTWQNVAGMEKPPTMDDLGLEYYPQYLFDRSAIYFTRRGGWTCNYWSEKNWQKIDYPEPPATSLATRTD